MGGGGGGGEVGGGGEGGGGFGVGKRLERCSFLAAGEACKAISSSSFQALKREHF